MSQNDYYGDKPPTKPLPDLVVRSSFLTSVLLVAGFALFMLLTGFTKAHSLPRDISGPPGPVAVAVGPQGATQTPDPSDEGATGPMGLLGSRLPSGPQGPKGDPGASGTIGLTGPMGPMGPQGVMGLPGPAGATGATGPQGEQGLPGIQGIAGLNGVDGATGPMGPIGPQGEKGDTGAQGEQGIPGATGAKGDTGLTGDTGPMGPIGPQGEKGDTGPQGAIGPTGETGPMGPAGPQGETGAKGDTGATGAKGDKGDTGAQGPAGPPGPPGISGSAIAYTSVWSGTGLSYSSNPVAAYYIKNGPLVHFRIYLSMASVTNFGTGHYFLTLPFSSVSDYIFRDGAIHSVGSHEHYAIAADVDPGETSLSLFYPSGTRDIEMDHNSPYNLTTQDYFYISGTYETNE